MGAHAARNYTPQNHRRGRGVCCRQLLFQTIERGLVKTIWRLRIRNSRQVQLKRRGFHAMVVDFQPEPELPQEIAHAQPDLYTPIVRERPSRIRVDCTLNHVNHSLIHTSKSFQLQNEIQAKNAKDTQIRTFMSNDTRSLFVLSSKVLRWWAPWSA